MTGMTLKTWPAELMLQTVMEKSVKSRNNNKARFLQEEFDYLFDDLSK